VRLDALPERARIAPRPSTPARFASFLRDRWSKGERNVRRLLLEVRREGYTGCHSRLAAFVAKWRNGSKLKPARSVSPEMLPLDPRTGAVISPVVAAALCIKRRNLLTGRQAEKVDLLKEALPRFASMRSLAMRFRGLLRSRGSRAFSWLLES
jgi:hypothetical protein